MRYILNFQNHCTRPSPRRPRQGRSAWPGRNLHEPAALVRSRRTSVRARAAKRYFFTYQRKNTAIGRNFCAVLPWKMLRRELTFPVASEIMNTLKAQATDGTWSTTWKPAVIRTVDRLGKPVLHGDPWGAVYPFFICIFIFLRRKSYEKSRCKRNQRAVSAVL